MNKAIFHIGNEPATLVDLPFLPPTGATITADGKTWQVTKITYQLHDGICTPVVHCIRDYITRE